MADAGRVAAAVALGECPIPAASDCVQLVHGAGGEASRRLIDSLFARELGDPLLVTDRDAATFEMPSGPGQIALTTDSFVVHPLEFPGGDIGCLAVYGTVNDLAVSGARPLYLSIGFILEEGLSLATLARVVGSVGWAARACGVHVVTGDTKVVERGKGDGVYINTAGVGWLEPGRACGPSQVQPGDVLLVSGDVGRHGLAILALREGLGFETRIESDCGSVVRAVEALWERGIRPRCMRDPTRGGVVTAVVEIARSAGVEIELESLGVPVRADVRAACDVLGLDPLEMACEGRVVLWVAEAHADAALACLRELDPSAARVGRVRARAEGRGRATLRTEIGTTRWLDLPSGIATPRIC